jgi:gamma-glutamyltranspeptidase/glutathione hydrolase/leukotriene-C4 hydrolase
VRKNITDVCQSLRLVLLRLTIILITQDRTHELAYYHPHFDIKEDHGTTHISVIDQWGSAISITSTVNLLFGSQVMDESTGIIMNDEMDDFATPGISDAFGLAPSPFNYPEPGKRPLSSTSPLIMDHFNSNETWLAIGGSGGSRIFPSVTQVIMNLDWGYDVDNSVQQSRYDFF